MNVLDNEIERLDFLRGSKFLQAYLECSDEIQSGIRDMLQILNDPDVDSDDREMTLVTLVDALFPHPHEGKVGLDLEESERMGSEHSEETRGAIAELDREEANFAENLQRIMEDRRMTQEELAAKAGVGQPAISNMLARQCRPQRRTVLRFAEVLGVPAEELWPGIKPAS